MMLPTGYRRSKEYYLLDNQYLPDSSDGESIRSWDDGVEGSME
jgi:hypothetical protein